MPRNADELHDALVWLGFLTAAEVEAAAWLDAHWLDELAGAEARGARSSAAARASLWIAAERLPQFRALWPAREPRAADRAAGRLCRARQWSREDGAGRDRCAAGWRAWGRSRQRALAAAARR